ncbi:MULTISPECIES: bifunctional diguanylate cyclase/phosphodiesterase [Pseudomonadota]|uniref:bifunctional diguanylate cyclase/phosphodiesterase n=3 Tax=Pseudomonadota TaxID=1224 RepID=UPI00076A3318|nr:MULTISPECIES: EAL domain-containing protein [Pseudomonadota]MAF62434.1 diguanylate cyclase [Blastomonas sp.]
MFDILFCIRDDHDIRFVGLAAAICLLSTITAVLMIRQARSASARARLGWAVAGGFATGFGIWSTHFVAMLGYDPGIIVGYEIARTAGSLLVVLATTIAAMLIATRGQGARALAAASVLAGSGFAAMHYVGMAALEMPALIRWNMGYLALSVALAIVPLYPALALARRRTSLASGLSAALIMTGAIVGLHFSGMTAIDLVPSRIEGSRALLSPTTMSILITLASACLLMLCLSGLVIARRTRAAIRASEMQFGALIKGISDCAIYMLDAEGRVANWNAGAQRLKGYRPEEIVGKPLSSFYLPEERADGVPERALVTARETGKFSGEGWRVRKDGTRFWAQVTIERFCDESGRLLGFAKITRDITRLKEDQDRIAEARRHRDAALDHMHQGLCLFDARGRLVLANRRFAEMWGLGNDQCPPGTGALDVLRTALAARTGEATAESQLARIWARLEDSLRDPSLPPFVLELDEDLIVAMSSRSMADGGWVTTIEDITARRRSEEQIVHMALHDGLTGLPNRTSFNQWLDGELAQAAVQRGQVAVIAIDLDRFKEINDTHGHAAGDRVLQQIGTGLAEVLERGEIAARVGGDEFAVAKHYTDPAELEGFVARISASLAPGEGEAASVGASFGIATYPGDAQGRESLLNNADLAMYRAKASPGETICYYQAGMDEDARHRRQIANELRHALARDEFRLLYQPQRSLRTHQISGYEALLRWKHPRLGHISPMEFIPIAEQTGEIIKIGEWVLREACREAASWTSQDKVAVNLSPVQLLQPDLPEMVTSILMETGLAPRRLELEITETALITEKTRALHSLRRIKALGVSVAMDDFGTGYSSLDTLHSFPFDKIKIDKSFLLQSGESPQAQAIIRAVLALGRSLGIPVLAEGVETLDQLKLLVDEGCDEAQGYLFGRPAAMQSASEEQTALRA